MSTSKENTENDTEEQVAENNYLTNEIAAALFKVFPFAVREIKAIINETKGSIDEAIEILQTATNKRG